MTTPDNVVEVPAPTDDDKPRLEAPAETPPEDTVEEPAAAPEPTTPRPQLEKYLRRDGDEPTPEPEPTVPQPSVEEQRLQQEVATLRQQQAAQQAQQQQEALRRQAAETANARAQQYVQQGQITQEQAPLFAQELQQMTEQALTREAQLQNYAQHLEGKSNAAAQYAAQYGITHKELMQFDSPQAMEAHAKTQARVNKLEAAEAKRTKGQVPAQTFSEGVTQSAAGSEDAATRRHTLATKEGLLTDEEHKELGKLINFSG